MSDDDDDVGYKKPPKRNRWPKGVSGNPKGREKGHKGLKTDLEAALNTTSELENKLTGRTVKGRHQKLAIDRLVERAALGDLKAQALLFPMMMQVLGVEDRHQGKRKLSVEDEQLLAEVLGSRLAEAAEAQPDAGGNGNRDVPPPEAPIADEPEDEEGDDAQGA